MQTEDPDARWREPRERRIGSARGVTRSARHSDRESRSVEASGGKADGSHALPAALSIDVSNVCNLACAVCPGIDPRGARTSAFLSFERFVSLYDDVRPATLLLTGPGEPLLNKDLARMVAHASADGARVALRTNGTLLDDRRRHALLDAGLAKLKVSIEAADAIPYARMRGGADLEAVLDGAVRFLNARTAKLEIRFDMFRENADQVVQVVRLVRDRLPGVEVDVRLGYAADDRPSARARALAPRDLDSPAAEPPGVRLPLAQDAEFVHAIDELLRARRLAVRYGFRRTRGSIDAALGLLTPDPDGPPRVVPWYRAHVSTTGDVYPCCARAVREARAGNAFERSFASVWSRAASDRFRARLDAVPAPALSASP